MKMISIEDFEKLISDVHSVISRNGDHFKNIHIDGSNIIFTTEVGSSKSIETKKLHDVYILEQRINETKLKNYISSSNVPFSLALLKAAGLYNADGYRKIKPESNDNIVNDEKKWSKKLIYFLNNKIFTRITLAVFHLIPVIIIIYFIIFYYVGENKGGANIIVGLIIFLVNLSFFIYVAFFKKDRIQESTYTSYFQLLIFNIGIFPLFNFVKDYKEKNKVEVNYTIGLRAWGTTVRFSDIEIFYYDKFGNPKELTHDTVNNSTFWTPEIWTDLNNELKFQKASRTFEFDKVRHNLFITLTNCGIIIKPEVFDNEKITDYFVKAHVVLLKVDPQCNDKNNNKNYPSSQICLRVPVNTVNKKASEIYYGYEFTYRQYSWTKLHIPAFNFDYIKSQLSYRINNNRDDANARQIVQGIKNEIIIFKKDTNKNVVNPNDSLKDMKIHLSALLHDDYASFYIYKDSTSLSYPLFSFKISEYGAFNLKVK